MQLNLQQPDRLTKNDTRLANRPQSSIPIFPKGCGPGYPLEEYPEVCVTMPLIGGSNSAEFTCRSSNQDCHDNCKAENFLITKAVMTSDEGTWPCGRKNIIDEAKEQSFNMDFYCGCDDGDNNSFTNDPAAQAYTFLNQKHDATSASCGLVKVEVDVYVKASTGWGDSPVLIDGETWHLLEPNKDLEGEECTSLSNTMAPTSDFQGIAPVGSGETDGNPDRVCLEWWENHTSFGFSEACARAKCAKSSPCARLCCAYCGEVNTFLYFGGDLATKVKEIRAKPETKGTFRQSYTKRYPNLCSVKYKVDFTIGNWSNTTNDGGSSMR